MTQLELALEVIKTFARHSIGCCRPVGLECDCGLSEYLAELGIAGEQPPLLDLSESNASTSSTTIAYDSAKTIVWGTNSP